MVDMLSVVSRILSVAVYVSFIIIFYISIKNCFLREGQSKVKLFFLTIFTNPIVAIMLSFVEFLIALMFYVIKNDMTTKEKMEGMITPGSEYWPLMTKHMLISSFIFILLTILFSYLVGKRLKAYNVSLVIFVYTMYTVVYALYGSFTSNPPTEYYDISNIFHFITQIGFFVAEWLLYCHIIKPLTGLTDRKRKINWKTFLLPPCIFLMAYDVLSFYSINMSYDADIILQVMSWVILFMFIWAFHVIINNIRATNEALDAKDEIKELSVEVMEALAHTIDAKDTYTNGHSIRVAKYSRMIAEQMGLSEEMCENIYYMGLLHDIGKIGVPNEIINKPTRLTDEEYNVIKTHPGIGYDILSQMKSRLDLAKGARWHHERYDGKGYPDKMEGEDIPLEARIIAVADSYDAMTSNRSYRKYLAQDVVREEIERNIGTQFDENAARCMLQIIDNDTEYTMHE